MTIDKVKALLASQLNISEDKISESSDVVKDLGADSLDIVEMLMALESECNITVPEDEITDIKTVGDIVKMIDSVK